MSYEIQLRARRYELGYEIYNCALPADDVRYDTWTVVWLYGADVQYSSSVPAESTPAYVGTVPYNHQPLLARFIRWEYWACRLQDVVKSTGEFDSIVVVMLKQVLCSSCNGAPLKFEKKTLAVIQISSVYRLSLVSWTILLNSFQIHNQ